MSSVISIALPVFSLILLGIVAGRTKLAGADDSAALNRFVYRFAFPAALFGLMSSASGLGLQDGMLALSYGAAAITLMMAIYFLTRKVFSLAPQEAGAHSFASILGNAVFLGLPIAMSIDGWVKPFVTLMLVEGIVVISLGAVLMTPGDRQQTPVVVLRQAIVRPLKNPLVAAALAGFAFSLAGLTLPGPVRDFLDLVGRAAGPVALFSLGLFFSSRPVFNLRAYSRKLVSVVLVKMVALPLLALALLGLIGIDDPSRRGALALFTCVPTAVAAYVMASQYDCYVDETAAAIAVTTALSILSISAVLILFT